MNNDISKATLIGVRRAFSIAKDTAAHAKVRYDQAYFDLRPARIGSSKGQQGAQAAFNSALGELERALKVERDAMYSKADHEAAYAAQEENIMTTTSTTTYIVYIESEWGLTIARFSNRKAALARMNNEEAAGNTVELGTEVATISLTVSGAVA